MRTLICATYMFEEFLLLLFWIGLWSLFDQAKLLKNVYFAVSAVVVGSVGIFTGKYLRSSEVLEKSESITNETLPQVKIVQKQVQLERFYARR